jgi:integrase
MRGDGFVFQKPGTKFWWVGYSFRGKQYQESSKSTDKRVAERLLKRRLKQVEKPSFVSPAKEEKWTLDDMLEQIRLDYSRKQNRTFGSVEFAFKHLQEGFKFHRVIDITSEKIGQYTDKRLEAGASRSSVNIELAHLRRGFRLMREAGMISSVPVIKTLSNLNVREGFLSIPDFEAAAATLENEDTRDIICFLYESAWRSGEAKGLLWDKIDLHDWVIRLPRKSSKNKKPRTLVLEGDLKDIIVRRLAKRRPDCPYVFHRNGRPIRSFRKAFKIACKAVGLEGMLPHDMRRSGIRNLRRAGNDEHDCMEISGHETRAIFDRYDIIDEDDQREALKRRQEYKRQQMEQGRKVVPLKRESALG